MITTHTHFKIGLFIICSFFWAAFSIPFFSSAQVSGEEAKIASAFQSLERVPAQALSVPTVVSVPVVTSATRNETFLVYDDQANAFVGSQLISQREVIDLANQASTVPVQSTSWRLVDNDRTTTVDFPVGESEKTTTAITLQNTTGQKITADRLQLDLAPHVSLPLSVVIRAQVDGVQQTVVAPRSVPNRTIMFPEVTADFWVIEFTYAQPLRIAELTLAGRDVFTTPSHELRFLAQPNTSYTVYSQPDRNVLQPRLEVGNLSNDEDVITVNTTGQQMNPRYLPADIDEDGIRDVVDNCVRTENPDQTDLNQNGKGDACEDFDRDGRMNPVDNCPDIPNRNQADEDGDGIGNVCDDEESRFTERHAWVPWVGMGLAVVVIIALFAIVGLKPEETKVEENEEDTNDTDPQPQ